MSSSAIIDAEPLTAFQPYPLKNMLPVVRGSFLRPFITRAPKNKETPKHPEARLKVFELRDKILRIQRQVGHPISITAQPRRNKISRICLLPPSGERSTYRTNDHANTKAAESARARPLKIVIWRRMERPFHQRRLLFISCTYVRDNAPREARATSGLRL